MSDDAARLRARFSLHLICDGCETKTVRRLDVPDVEDAPENVDELLESAFFQRQHFICHVCDNYVTNMYALAQDELPAGEAIHV